MAITDETYFDWAFLPEAPSSLEVSAAGDSAKLTWQVHGGDPIAIVVERQMGDGLETRGHWDRIAKLSGLATEYTDSGVQPGHAYGYRVRAVNGNGESAYSNVARTR